MATRGWQDVKPSDIQRMQARGSSAQPPVSKHRNVPCQIGAEKFQSRHEADTWLGLVARQKAGEIHGLQRQVPFALHSPDQSGEGVVLVQICQYFADYVYYDDTQGGKRIVMDAKGQKKRICPYPLKRKMMAAEYGIEIVEV